MPPKVLVTGSKGQLGSELMTALGKSSYSARGVNSDDFDITNQTDLDEYLHFYKPDVIIHTASFTNVEKCESKRDLAFSINAEAAKNIAIACSKIGSKLFFYSSDYVFDGNQKTPYTETDKPNPLNVMARANCLAKNM